MTIANLIAYILVLIGGINWGLVGLFNFNLVAAICMGSRTAERLIYILVLIATIWLIIAPIIDGALYLGANPFANNTTPTV
ncbi:MAG: DUF378 domain-containing protein [Clostridiales bacterium]|nr:DUF378 domain-containing protein [Clostridiales bacterium]